MPNLAMSLTHSKIAMVHANDQLSLCMSHELRRAQSQQIIEHYIQYQSVLYVCTVVDRGGAPEFKPIYS